MQYFFRGLIAAAGLALSSAAVVSHGEAAARAWLAAHQSPGADEMAELKAANPEAAAIVQALLTKQAMGLVKRSPRSSMPEESLELPPLTAPVLQPAPEMLTPAPPSIVAQGPPEPRANAKPAPADLPEFEIPVTAPPPMPPPQPLSPPLPPEIEDLPPAVPDSPVETSSSDIIKAPRAHLSAASMGVSASSASSAGHSWLNWNPDQMIADNEKMVQNVLGAVAQLTGAHVQKAQRQESSSSNDASQATTLSESGASAEADAENIAPPAPPPRQQAVPRTSAGAQKRKSNEASKTVAVENKEMQPDSSDYAEAAVAREQARTEIMPVESSLPPADAKDVSWSNPYTFAASANAKPMEEKKENEYLKGADLGEPLVRLPPKRNSDDDNPYLNGLDLTGAGPRTPPPSQMTNPNTLSALHQSQLLKSHRLLASFDWGDEDASQKPSVKNQARRASKMAAPKKGLGDWLGTNKAQAPPPPTQASLASKNQYLVKLGTEAVSQTAAAAGIASKLAADIEKDNPYLQALDGSSPVQAPPPAPVAQPNLRAGRRQESRDRLASFKWDDAPQPAQRGRHMSMASSHVNQKVSDKKVAKKANLYGWLGGGAAPQVADIKAQRLQEAVQQKVADAKNPYLKGLDIDNGVPKVQVGNDQANPYMSNLD